MFRIAVCDDEEYFRIREKKLIEEYMKSRGFTCQTDLFPSGKEMLEAAESIQQYDVIYAVPVEPCGRNGWHVSGDGVKE